jgi:hypothetical protein
MIDGLSSAQMKYLAKLGDFLLARLDAPKPYRTIKFEPECISYGPHVIPSHAISGVGLRSGRFQSGTPARQIVGILVIALLLLVFALVDAGAN